MSVFPHIRLSLGTDQPNGDLIVDVSGFNGAIRETQAT
jgi:hypothetical protein